MGQSFTGNQSNVQASSNLDEISEDENDEEQMYFREPSQLIDIFHSLEESNLFLITNLKEIEQETEEIKSAFMQTKEQLNEKKNELLNNKTEILKQIQQTDEEL